VWKAIAIGGSGLAKHWASVIKKWPSSEGYEHIFLKIFQAGSDFVLLSHAGKTEMIPLSSAVLSLDLGSEEMYDPSDIILRLKRPVLENIGTYGH